MELCEIEQELINAMADNGISNIENFDKIIKAAAKIVFDYNKALVDFEKSGGEIVIQHTNKVGATNMAKNPFYLAIENLRNQQLLYLRELGLTPSGLKKLNDTLNKEKGESKLEKALDEMLK